MYKFCLNLTLEEMWTWISLLCSIIFFIIIKILQAKEDKWGTKSWYESLNKTKKDKYNKKSYMYEKIWMILVFTLIVCSIIVGVSLIVSLIKKGNLTTQEIIILIFLIILFIFAIILVILTLISSVFEKRSLNILYDEIERREWDKKSVTYGIVWWDIIYLILEILIFVGVPVLFVILTIKLIF